MSTLSFMPTADLPSPSDHKLPGLFSGKAWQQVLTRDASADGQFVYAVRSTRVFCRPSCPSRRPSRKNVTFFPTPAAAEEAGFRACLRCQPALATPRPDPHAAAVAKVTSYLKEQAAASGNRRLDLDQIARATGIPRLTIVRAFKRVLGTTPTQFARAQRLDAFRGAVAPSATRKPRITDAIYEAGFSSSSRLYETSNAALGMTPTSLRKGAPAETIHYTISPSPLGRTLVAATEKGICSIAFASSDAVLRHDLRERFPKAALVEQTGKSTAPSESVGLWLTQAVEYVLAHLTESPAATRFPLDIRSTAFQQRVWQALQQIPRGQTVSYSALARQLGKPNATRAVAAACASNPLALAVPCHRVVGANGALTGYRWGLERKQKILAAERDHASTSNS